MLVETDSPYLTPEERRGERNTPLSLKYITGKLSRELGIEESEVIEATARNARELFGI